MKNSRFVLVVALVALLAACGSSSSSKAGKSKTTTTAGSTSTTMDATPTTLPSSSSTEIRPAVNVATADQLTEALANAKPGQGIVLADGTYVGQFTLAVGNVAISGSRSAIIDGGKTSKGYALHLLKADDARLTGFTLSGAQKGLVLDQSSGVIVESMDIGGTGDEGVHFRDFSSNNIIENSQIADTGLHSPQYGEGVYIGTAKSNWKTNSGGKPDASNNNQILNNRIVRTTAENIDIKESTTGGTISGNKLDGSAISGKNYADSLIDVKGSNYKVINNTATGSTSSLLDGFQTHVISEGGDSGNNNTFSGNSFAMALPGYGINIDSKSTGTVIKCDNSAANSKLGASNAACSN